MEGESKQLFQKQELQKIEIEDTHAEESSRLSDYHKHKLFLGFLKIIPMAIAGLYLLNTVLSYYDIEWPAISYFAGTGIVPWLFIMFASYIFKFCEYHRMFLWYVLTNNFICWIDSKYPLPISNWDFFVLHISVAGLFMFLVLYFHQKCKKKS